MKLSVLIETSTRGEVARQKLEDYYRKVSGDELWSVKDLTVAELVNKIIQSLKDKENK